MRRSTQYEALSPLLHSNSGVHPADGGELQRSPGALFYHRGICSGIDWERSEAVHHRGRGVTVARGVVVGRGDEVEALRAEVAEEHLKAHLQELGLGLGCQLGADVWASGLPHGHW